MSQGRFVFAFVIALACGLGACSGSSEPFIANGPPTISIPGGGSTLTLTGATGTTASLTVTEVGYVGLFTASSSNTKVATVSPASLQSSLHRRDASGASLHADAGGSGTFTITSVGNGTTTISISDANGNTSKVTVNVTGATSATPIASPSSIALTAVGQTQAVAVTETGYTGTFTAASVNTGVATVSPVSGTGPFTVTAVAAGSTTVTFTDSQNGVVSVSVGVTTAGGVITITHPKR